MAKWQGYDGRRDGVPVLDPATPVRIDAFDGSHFGPADADLKVKIATPNCMYQLLAHPNEIGIVRSYILGDFDVDGIDYADPYPAMRKLVSLSKYVRPPPPPTSIARVSAGIPETMASRSRRCPPPRAEQVRPYQAWPDAAHQKADSETVSFHYDMSNEFYADFLGSSHDLHLRGIRQRTHEPLKTHRPTNCA